VSKSKEHEYNSPQCFHWGHSIDIKEEQKKEEQNNDEPPTLTKEEEEKFLKYKEIKTSYYKKKGVMKYWGKSRFKGMKTSIDLL